MAMLEKRLAFSLAYLILFVEAEWDVWRSMEEMGTGVKQSKWGAKNLFFAFSTLLIIMHVTVPLTLHCSLNALFMVC